jgi:hypothetical protein
MKILITHASLLLFVSLMLVQEGYCQNSVYREIQAFKSEQGHAVQSNKLFKAEPKSTRSDAIDKVIKKATFLTLNPTELKRLNDVKINRLDLQLPYQRDDIQLELIRSQLFTEDFSVITDKSNGKPVDVKQGAYFRGVIKNDPNSLVTLSIYDDEVIGIIASDKGNIILGNINEGTENEYMIYNDRDLLVPFSFECGTPDIAPNSDLAQEIKKLRGHKTIGDRTTKCVRMYLELDYTLVSEKGGVQGAVNWMTAVYNQVQALYSIDNITTSISQIFTWTTEDPYNFSSTGEALNKFRVDRPSYNGDLAHLISRGAPTGGGVAWLNALCSNSGYAYSFVNASYQSVPTYSWTVKVIAHEIGHNFGSPHTHSCTWPGGAIDGCGPTANPDWSEGTCAIGPIPADGGTIMSYCHHNPVGINLNKGFGYYPALLITQKINSASCLSTSCTSSAVNTPTAVSATDGTFTDKVRITWSGTSGNYFRVFRNITNVNSTATPLGSWQTSTTYDDLSATAGTTYYYFVRAASNSSGASMSGFSTGDSGLRSAAPLVTSPTSVDASDGTYTDKVRITWSGTSGNFFRVIRNTSNSTSAGVVISNWQNTQLIYDDLSAAAGTTYYYFVQAASSSTGTNASSYSLINSGYRSTAPVVTIPSSVNASDGTYTDKVRITWSGTSGNFFRVIRNTSNSTSAGVVISNWQNTQLIYDDLSAAAGTTYYYFVQAASSSTGTNASSYSLINSGYRSTAPVVTIPSSVNASDGTYTDKVRITWSGTSGNFFRVIRNTSNSTSAGVVISNWQNTQLIYDDLSAAAGTTYYYFVQASSNSSGSYASAYSLINSGFRSTAPTVTIPSAVDASDGTYTDKVRITWSGTAGNYFRIYRGTTSSSFSCLPICTWQNTQLFFDDFTAIAGTTYYYFVQAASANDGTNQSYLSTYNSGWRSAVSCGTVSNLTVSQITSNSAKLSWNAISGASQYSVWYNNNATWTEIGKVSQNSASISGLSSGSRYCFAIKAVCGGSTGNFSNSICFNTLAYSSITGSNDQSESIIVAVSPTVQVNVYPNPIPIYANLTLEFNSELENTNMLILMNATGNVILKIEVPVTIGANTIQIPAPETPGMYICQMLTGKQTLFVRKIMVSEN